MNNGINLRWALLCLLLGFSTLAGAQTPLIVEGSRLNAALHARYLEDPTAAASIEQIRATTAGWQDVEREVPHFGFSSSAHWLSLELDHHGPHPLQRLLEIGYPMLDHVEVWLYGADGQLLYHELGGDTRAFGERAVRHRHFVFPLRLPADAPSTLFVRVSGAGSLQVPLTLWEPEAFEANSDLQLVLISLYAGLMLGIIVYNLFIYFSARLPAYMYYVLFVSCVTLLLLELRGMGYQFLWPGAVWWQQAGSGVLIAGIIVFGSLFTHSFLNIRQHSRLFHRLLLGALALGLVNLALVPADSFTLAAQFEPVAIMVWIVVLLGAGIAALRRGETSARYFLAAWAMLMISGFLTALYQFSDLSLSLVGEYTLLVGSALEALLLSFALADRINRIREEKDLAQREALVSLSQYQRLYQEARYGIFSVDGANRVIGCNPACARVLGYASPQELREQLRDFDTQLYVNPADRQRLRAELDRRGHIDDFETQLWRSNREPVWVSLSARQVEGSEGQVIEGSLLDISERKRREHAERARELAEAEREAATLAAQAKSAFLSNMSHEIRTPLTAVIGYGEFLLEPEVSEAQRHELASVVVRSGRHLLELINDILDLSKIEAGLLEVEQVPVDLVELLADVRSLFQARAREQGLWLKVDHQLPLPRRILSDPTRLKQILYNLCSNAVKFTPSGGITIEVAWRADTRQVRLSVIDTGVGIAADKHEQVFDAFAQADASTARRYGGTGLGLSISRQLARRLGGDIALASELGRGSRFTVTVAAKPADAAAMIERPEQLQVSDAESSAPVRPPRLAGRVLYVEDIEESRRLMQMLMAPTGAQLVTAEDGHAAIARAARERFDLVLMDIQMPGLDGFGALEGLRRAGYTGPVVAMTANVMDEDRERYAAAGFDDCAPKPIDRPAFYQLLQRYLPAAAATPAEVRGRVLLVEDTPASRQLIEWHIRRCGATVHAAETGEAALAAAATATFDLVLLDKELPGIDGLETARRLRAGGCDAPMYMLTADTDERVRRDARAAGCAGALAKPLEPARLYEVIGAHLQADADDDDDPELAQIRRGFIEHLPGLLARMNSATAAGDWAATAAGAHQLAGNGESFGFSRLTELGRALEKTIKAGNPAQAQLDELSAYVDEIVSEHAPA